MFTEQIHWRPLVFSLKGCAYTLHILQMLQVLPIQEVSSGHTICMQMREAASVKGSLTRRPVSRDSTVGYEGLRFRVALNMA